MQLHPLFVIALAVTAFAAATPKVFKRTVPEILADLATLNTQVTTLGQLARAVPTTPGQATLTQALAIHNSALATIPTIERGTADTLTTLDFSLGNGRLILNSGTTLSQIVIDTINQLIIRESAFRAIPLSSIAALLLQDCIRIRGLTTSFGNALLAKTPLIQIAEARSILASIDAAFLRCIAAFSSIP